MMGVDVVPGSEEPAIRMVDMYEAVEVGDHQLFRYLRGNAVDLPAIWLLMANLKAGISHDFVPWLANTIVRLDDRRICSLLAKQLNDELGNGDESSIHSVLLDRFVAALERWRPRALGDEALAPGRALAASSFPIFFERPPYESVGALIVGEIFAKKMDLCLGAEIRRQDCMSQEELTWLRVHECLEIDHAEDSKALAALVPTSGAALSASWRGGMTQWSILWSFLDRVDAVRRAM